MTPEQLAARWLADVTRQIGEGGYWLSEADALAAIARHLAPGEWKPIETAPRNGEWFKARTEHGTVRTVHFADAHDRYPISGDGEVWSTAPVEWMPLTPDLTPGDDLVERLQSACNCNFPETTCGAEDQCRLSFAAADRLYALTAERDEAKHLAFMRKAFIEEARDERDAAEAEVSRLLDRLARMEGAAKALRDDMLERARTGLDAIHGEDYRIVNAGSTAWFDFCAALETPADGGKHE